jgi:hypothetical protein
MSATLIIYPLNDSNAEVPYVLDSNEVDIALTLTVQDIQDVAKRRGSFSKTIALPGTDANNQAFGYAYNIQSFVGGFTPNKRIRCVLWDNGVQTFSGSLQLLSMLKDGGKVTYEVGIFSEEVAFFRKVNETLLTQTAGVSGFNHSFTASGVSGTFGATAGSGYVYGFIDGYGYSDAQPGTFNTLTYNLLMPYLALTPSFYVKQIVDLIFAQAGYRYESAFFDSARFKKLVIPYAGGATLQEDLSGQDNSVQTTTVLTNVSENFPVVESGTYRFPDGVTQAFNRYAGIIPFDDALLDPQVFWDLTDHYLTNVGFYTEWSVNYTVTIENKKATSERFFIAVCDRTTGQPINRPLYNIQNGIDFQVWSGELQPSQTKKFDFNGTVRLYPNQEMDLRLFYILNDLVEDPYPFEVNEGAQITMICTSNPVAIGTVDMVRALPPEITQADLLSDLQKMFNLYFYQSPVDPSLIYVEPFEDFYTSGSVDWTQKVDQNGEHLITAGDPEARKQITFRYRNAGDALSKLYDSTFLSGYGSREWKTDNYYAKGEQVVETKCATVIPASYNSGLVIGRTFDIDANGLPKEKPTGYRIAQYNNVDIPSNAPWLLLVDLTPTFQAFTTLPFISHVDNPYNPTFDLAFGIPKQLYYQAYENGALVNYTRSNLFNTYWLNYILETTSKESLQIEVPVMLDAVDIYNLDFRKPIYMDGILFRLLEIRDYVVGGKTRCTAVLRRILNLAAPTLGDVDVLTYFDSETLVLGEMRPQTQQPNNLP